MSYFVFNNLLNFSGTLCKIAENDHELNNLIINKDVYKIIEVSQEDFEKVKHKEKLPMSFGEDNVINYLNLEGYSEIFETKDNLNLHIKNTIDHIKEFLDKNKNHPLYSKWENYCNQLLDINVDLITFPLKMSLEQYLKQQNKIVLNTLQLP